MKPRKVVCQNVKKVKPSNNVEIRSNYVAGSLTAKTLEGVLFLTCAQAAFGRRECQFAYFQGSLSLGLGVVNSRYEPSYHNDQPRVTFLEARGCLTSWCSRSVQPISFGMVVSLLACLSYVINCTAYKLKQKICLKKPSFARRQHSQPAFGSQQCCFTAHTSFLVVFMAVLIAIGKCKRFNAYCL